MDKIFLNISFSLLCGIFTIFSLSFLGFIFKIDINPLYTVIGIITAFCILNYRCKNLEKKERNKINRLVILSIILMWFISNGICDNTPDGFAYHMPAANLLKKGYNPIYDNIFEVAKMYFPPGSKSFIWIECYPKFSEIFAANIFSLTNSLEAGKIFNYLTGAIAFLYTFYVFSKRNFKPLGKRWALIFSFLLFYNPVVIYQLPTFYIDGLLYFYFLIAILSFADFYLDKNNSKIPLLIFIMSGVIISNIKLGGLLCFICFALSGIIFIKNIEKLKKFYTAVLISVILILLSGINPYFTNLKQDRNAFYPAIGKDKIDIMTHATPKDFINKPYYHNFFMSVFSKSSNNTSELKIPFTTNMEEICTFGSAYTRIGGFGVFFSGMLLVSLIMLFITKYKKRNRGVFIFLYTLSFLPVILNPISWWARYIPYFWSFVVFVVIGFYVNCSKKIEKCLASISALLLFINSLLVNISLFLTMI